MATPYLLLSYSVRCHRCAETGLQSLWLSVCHGASLGDFLLARACHMEKVTLWVGALFNI